jgi:hypothetical protein
MKLNETICKNAKPASKPKKLADGLGLYLEVTPTGLKLGVLPVIDCLVNGFVNKEVCQPV